jgi:hypothetical protein
MKPLFRAPKIDREWRTTLILASVAALLFVAVAIEVAVRYFWIQGAGGKVEEGGMENATARSADYFFFARKP